MTRQLMKKLMKPEIVTFYNSTKGGVDTFDQVIRCYSSKRKTNRWPVALFFNVLDIAAYNAYILYTNDIQNLCKFTRSNQGESS